MNSNNPVRSGINLQTIIAVLAGAYGVSPIDAIPDIFPVIGQADDAVVIVLALVLMIVITIVDRGGAK